MSECSAAILPFTLRDRWIVTVESERHLVKVRHHTRWYAVAQRIGHENRRHWCASRADALVIAGWQRGAFDRKAELERFYLLYYAAPEWKRAAVVAYLESLRRQK